MSLTFSTIPLDCLALVCQHFESVRHLSRIQSVSRHWRTILLAADRYSHAYQNSASVILIKWTTQTDNCTSNENGVWRKACERPVGHALLDWLSLCFRHLRVFSFTLECDFRININGIKKLTSRIGNLRKSLYALIESFAALEHLYLSDRIMIEQGNDLAESNFDGILPSHERLADSMAHLTHLRTFHYDVACADGRANATQQLTYIPDSLVTAVATSKKMRMIGGSTFVQYLTQEQWIVLLESLTELEGIGSMNVAATVRLRGIANHATAAAQLAFARLHSLKLLEMAGETFTMNSLQPQREPSGIFYSLLHEIGCRQLRSFHHRFGTLYSTSANDHEPILMIANFSQLTSLTLDLRFRWDLTPLKSLIRQDDTGSNSSNKSITSVNFPHLYELTLENGTRIQAGHTKGLLKFLISLSTSLRCLILRECNSIDATMLHQMIESCYSEGKKLLELRIYDSDLAQLTPASIGALVESNPSLNLLTIQNIAQKFEVVNLDQLIHLSPKAGKMIEYAKRISWIDLLTLDRDEIQRRIKFAPPDPHSTEQSIDEAIRRFRGCEWRHAWLQLQQIDRMEAKMAAAAATKQKKVSPHSSH